MAQSFLPPGPSWSPRTVPYRTPASAIVFVVVIVFLIFLFVFVSAFTGAGFPFAMFAPFCGIFVVMIVVFAFLAAGGMGQRRIPPPPPIQQPMVPAGMQGPVELMCPNCGAPPRNVDRFGIATCDYCNTRFMVR